MPSSTLPNDPQWPQGLTSAFDDWNTDYTQEHAYTSNGLSGSNSGNVSYSYGPDELSNNATPSLTPSLPNNGTGHDDQSLYNNHSQSYTYAPSQQLLPTEQVESTTNERDATEYLLPDPPDATPPSPISESCDLNSTTSHALSLPVPTDSSTPKPKGRQSKSTKPAAPKAAKAGKKPAARGRRAAPKPSAVEQSSLQSVDGNSAAKVPAKRGRPRKYPLPEASSATATPSTVTQPVAGLTAGPAPAATRDKSPSQHANTSTAASVDQSQATPAIQSATPSFRSQSTPAGASTTLNKRKRDEEADDAQRDRDLMPPPPVPRSNFLNGKGKGRLAEPPASTIQFYLPCGTIALAPRLDPQYPAARGLVWITDQIHTGAAWPARLHTSEQLADLAYRQAFNSANQQILYHPRSPKTDNGKVLISSLILITLGAPVLRNQVPFNAVNADTAKVIPSELLSRFFGQLYHQESCRRSMLFEEHSFGFRRPINTTASNRYPYVGASSSNRQSPSVPQAAQSSHTPLLFPSSFVGYPFGPTSNAQNHRFCSQAQGVTEPDVQAPYTSSTFSFEDSSLSSSSEARTARQSTAPQELPYPFFLYSPAPVDSVTTSGFSTPTENTASTDSIGDAYFAHDPVDEAADSVLGDVDFFTNLPPSTNAEKQVDDDSNEFYKESMALPDEEFTSLYLAAMIQ